MVLTVQVDKRKHAAYMQIWRTRPQQQQPQRSKQGQTRRRKPPRVPLRQRKRQRRVQQRQLQQQRRIQQRQQRQSQTPDVNPFEYDYDYQDIDAQQMPENDDAPQAVVEISDRVDAEGECQRRVETLLEQIFDQFGGFELYSTETGSNDLIDKDTLCQLRQEAQKLKNGRKLHKVDGNRLAKLVQMLEKNIRDVMDEEGQLICKDLLESDDIDNEIARNLLIERYIRASEAATLALVIMTSHRAPKQAMVEETMEYAAQLCNQMLAHVIYPAADTIVRNSKGKKSDDNPVQRVCENYTASLKYLIYDRVADIIECFSELIRNFSVDEVTVALLSSMGSVSFFVNGIGQIQMASVQLLSEIFRKYDSFRQDIIQELLLSLHQLPPAKNLKNCYRLANNESIQNFTVLILQLVQSVVIIPLKKQKEEGEDKKPTEEDDTYIESGFKEAKKWSFRFLKSFLHKCTSEAEDDYRQKFVLFLQDLLAALFLPHWPAAELMLTVLGSILLNSIDDENLDVSQRIVFMDYLGTVAAGIRKNYVTTVEDASLDKTKYDMVVKSILFDEANDSNALLDDVDISQLSATEELQMLQQSLTDFLISTKSDNDVTAEYAICFHTGKLYRSIVDDIAAQQQRYQELHNENLSSEKIKDFEEEYQSIVESSVDMKEFLIKIAAKKHIKKRQKRIDKSGRIMNDSNAQRIVQYLASKKEFSQSFDDYLELILFEIQSDSPVTMRTKAMRCLSQIIESDSEVFYLPDVREVVTTRMMDIGGAVREATFDLIGKYLIFRPDLFDYYYSVLCDRIRDIDPNVRKSVIRIFRDYIDRVPKPAKTLEVLLKIVRCVSDEEGVKNLALETLMTYWFKFISNRSMLKNRVYTLIDTVTFSLNDPIINRNIEIFFTSVFKKDQIYQTFIKKQVAELDGIVNLGENNFNKNEEDGIHIVLQEDDVDRNTMYAAKQIISGIIGALLYLFAASKKNGLSNEETIEIEKLNQNRLLSSLTTLSMIGNIQPKLMVPYVNVFLPHLAKEPETQSELLVFNDVVNKLEIVIPLIEYPSEIFMKQVAAVCKKWHKIELIISKTFIQYIGFISKTKDSALQNNVSLKIPENVRGNLMRCIFSVGIMGRFFDFDKMIQQGAVEQEEEPSSAEHLFEQHEIGEYAETIYLYLLFFSRSTDLEVSKKALTSLGHLCSEYPDFLKRVEVRDMYQTLLDSTDKKHLYLKIEVLKNFILFLTVEGERMVKVREKYQRLCRTGQINFSNVNLNDLTNFDVIKILWKHVLSSYIHQDSEVRITVSQVVCQMMIQSIFLPDDSIPTIIAMTTDSIPSLLKQNESLLQLYYAKYIGGGEAIHSQAVPGIRRTFELQKKLNTNNKNLHGVRGFRATEHCLLDEKGLPLTSYGAIAILNILYECFSAKRNQRRSFLKNVIEMFSDDSPEKLQLEEMLFIADNLATFPYQVADEPLFIIHTADQIISLTGQNFLTNIKNLLLPKCAAGFVDEEDEFAPENIYNRLPDNLTAIFALMESSQACFLLLHIRTYLIKAYDLTEAKLKEYNPSLLPHITEKSITRRQIPVFRPDNALQELRPEIIAQRETFDGQINLCEQIGFFCYMLHSLDIHEEDLEEVDKQESSDETTTNEPLAKRRRFNSL